ncbi:hypothetical protein GQ457_03G021190 [Hibiscus cannabinus]
MRDKYLLVCGLYCVNELEGIDKGHYEQRPILLMADDKGNKEEDEVVVAVVACYTHKGFEKENRGNGLGFKI